MVRAALRAIAPPRQLGGRIRWLFLLFGMFNCVGVVPRVLGATQVPTATRAAAVVAAFALAAYWLAGYRRLRFPSWAIPVEALAFTLIGIGLDDWVGTVGLLFGAVAFRGLFGTWRHVLAFSVAAFAGSIVAVAVTAPEAVGSFLGQVTGVPPLAIFTAVVAVSTGRHERANAREKVFSEVGTRLATASDRDAIAGIAAEAGLRMLAGQTGGWAAVTLATEEGERVAASAGAVPADVVSAGLDVRDMPHDIAEPYAAGRGVYADASGYSLRSGTRLMVALRTDRQRYGTLVVGAELPVPDEVRQSIEALGGQTTLGLVNADYAADLRHQAFHDSLTGLPNRSLLRDRLAHAIARARRGSPTAVLLLDLDGFKQVNDSYGHATGDLLLIAVAQRLRDGVRGADTAARLGGDEFAVLLDGMESPEHALQVAGRLLDSVQAPLRVGGVELSPRGSVGVAIWQGHEIDALLHDADVAMYAAKSAGKGRVAYVTPGGDVAMLPGADVVLA